MFLDFYRLREQPFGSAPDLRYVYPNRAYQGAITSLASGIESERGFMALIAKPGMGKTTLLSQLALQFRDRARTVFLPETRGGDMRELLRHLLADLGIDAHNQDVVQMHKQLNEILMSESRSNRRFVLAIEDAHNLDGTLLEPVRLLSGFETSTSKLVQIVIAGRPELADRLATPELAQLRQRICVVSRLEPLAHEETQAYVEHRLAVAGYQGGKLFNRDAMALIATRSGGIPRNINKLCSNALSLGYALKEKTIDASVVREVVKGLESDAARSEESAAKHLTPEFGSSTATPSLHTTTRPRRRTGLRAALATSLVLTALGLPAWYGMVRKALPWKVTSERSPRVVRETITVVVKPHQTLQRICREQLGRYDNKLIKEILVLNPGIHDPNRIRVGDRIQLPRESVLRDAKVGRRLNQNEKLPTRVPQARSSSAVSMSVPSGLRDAR
jgi:type II secretory pathway predicted ATPase ExeA